MSDAVATAPRLGRRSVVLALVGAYFAAPAAFAYVQRMRWGIAFALAAPMVMFIAGRTGMVFQPWGYPTVMALLVLVVLCALVVVFRFARRMPAGVAPRWYNRWYHYAWIAAMTLALGAVAGTNRGTIFGYEAFRIPSLAMEPTLRIGDFIVADFRDGKMAKVERGDIVIYVPTAHPDQRWVKRVVGLPGETIDASAHRVRIDGKLFDEPWQTLRNGPAYPGEFEQVTLGPDEYYLMGDNRPHSEDSRFTGPVKRSALVAKARTIWFHYSPFTHSIDTSRIGPIADAPAR